jgi:hypothetical protein
VTRKTKAAASAPAQQAAVDPFLEVAEGDEVPRITELLGAAREMAQGMLEAEDGLRLVKERFERTEDPEAKAELVAEALDRVEHQLSLTRERRQALDRTEGKLWARRNRLERFLISARGRAWWRAHRNGAQPNGFASGEA